MATITPLRQTTSSPDIDHIEVTLHRGAALGALLAGAGWLAGTLTYTLGLDVLPVDALNRADAASILVAGAGFALAGVCVHLDSTPPRRWSWVAVVVAMVGYVASLGSWSVLITGEVGPGGQSSAGALLLLWMAAAGLAALVEGTWRTWLAAVTLVAGLGLVTVAQFGGMVTGVAVALGVAVWSVVFAAMYLLGPHARS